MRAPCRVAAFTAIIKAPRCTPRGQSSANRERARGNAVSRRRPMRSPSSIRTIPSAPASHRILPRRHVSDARSRARPSPPALPPIGNCPSSSLAKCSHPAPKVLCVYDVKYSTAIKTVKRLRDRCHKEPKNRRPTKLTKNFVNLRFFGSCGERVIAGEARGRSAARERPRPPGRRAARTRSAGRASPC